MKKYYTLSEEASLEKIFSENKATIEKEIYLGIHMNEDGKVFIKYSSNNTNEETVFNTDA